MKSLVLQEVYFKSALAHLMIINDTYGKWHQVLMTQLWMILCTVRAVRYLTVWVRGSIVRLWPISSLEEQTVIRQRSMAPTWSGTRAQYSRYMTTDENLCILYPLLSLAMCIILWLLDNIHTAWIGFRWQDCQKFSTPSRKLVFSEYKNRRDVPPHVCFSFGKVSLSSSCSWIGILFSRLVTFPI